MNHFSINFIRLKEPWRSDPYSDPPLGLLYVIATAKQHEENVSFTDMAFETDIPRCDIQALSGCTLDYPELIRVANRIKIDQLGKVIVGGPHFDAIPAHEWEKEIPNLPIDIICRGEGETTLQEALKHIRSGNKEKKVITQKMPLIDLNTVPPPAFDILNSERYFKPGKAFSGEVFNIGNSATMMTSRGCPFICSFCASPELHHRKVRFRSIENVKKELEILQTQYNVSEIRFQDDCFTINRTRFSQLSDLLEKAKINYRCSMRVDQVDETTLTDLHRGGCREIGFGIESAENHVLKLLDKRTTVELNKKSLKKVKENGFRTRAFMMTGLPGETKDSAKAMIDFLEETNPDIVTLTSFIPLPGSDIYRNPEKYGVTILDKDWEHYDISLKWQSNTPFVHRISTATIEDMEINREILKEYLFNRGKSNVINYNRSYVSDVL